MLLRAVLAVSVLFAGLVEPGAAMAAPIFFGPGNPYLSAADIPVGLYAGGSPAALEDFEDGSLDFGISASAGVIRGPGTATDSVDADDGSIDGSGLNGWQWISGDGPTGVTFTFPSAFTAAGIVWTDGAGVATFEAFGPGMVSLGTLVAAVGTVGTTGQTDEDTFFGVQDPNGIVAIKLSNSGLGAVTGIEMDHVQYGFAVPEPGTGALLSLGLAAIALQRPRARSRRLRCR